MVCPVLLCAILFHQKIGSLIGSNFLALSVWWTEHEGQLSENLLYLFADGEVRLSATDLHAGNYHIVGVDLRNLHEVESKLTESELKLNVPTLFLAECVLVYIDPPQVVRLLSWLASKFPSALFVNYEQVCLYIKLQSV